MSEARVNDLTAGRRLGSRCLAVDHRTRRASHSGRGNRKGVLRMPWIMFSRIAVESADSRDTEPRRKPAATAGYPWLPSPATRRCRSRHRTTVNCRPEQQPYVNILQPASTACVLFRNAVDSNSSCTESPRGPLTKSTTY